MNVLAAIAERFNTPADLYQMLSREIDTLNGVLRDAGADVSFRYQDDGLSYNIEKIEDGETQKLGKIESLYYSRQLESQLYAAAFTGLPATKNTATGVLTFMKMMLADAIDGNARPKLTQAPAASLRGDFLRAVVAAVENNPASVLHDAVTAEISVMNGRLEKTGAPFRFKSLYDHDALIVSRVGNDGEAHTAICIESMKDELFYRVSYDGVSADEFLNEAVARTKDRLREVLPDETRMALARLQLAEMTTDQPKP